MEISVSVLTIFTDELLRISSKMQRHYGVILMKNCLYIFILALAGTGFSTVISGASFLSKTKGYTHFLDSTIQDLSTALITVGSITFAVTIFGCFAGIKESFILLILFAIFLVAISVAEIAIAIMSGLKQYDIVQELQESITNYTTVRANKETWDYVHREFKCCGTDEKFVWIEQPIPLSCCHNYEMGYRPSEYCEYQGKGKYLYEEGCFDKLTEKMKIYARIIIGISIGSAYAKIVGIFLSCLLAFEIKE